MIDAIGHRSHEPGARNTKAYLNRLGRRSSYCKTSFAHYARQGAATTRTDQLSRLWECGVIFRGRLPALWFARALRALHDEPAGEASSQDRTTQRPDVIGTLALYTGAGFFLVW